MTIEEMNALFAGIKVQEEARERELPEQTQAQQPEQ